jgi:hypothetical protein
VVSGVLVALALQAGYQAGQDARSEREYLRQLRSDLETNRTLLRTAIGDDSVRVIANAAFLTALRRRTPPPAELSSGWFRLRLGFYSDPRPLLGTVNTLIDNGEIRLIRSARLRSELVAYASLMATDKEELGRNVTRLTQANDAERMRWERNGIEPFEPSGSSAAIEGEYSAADAARVRQIVVAAWPRFADDPELRASLGVRRIAFASRVFYLRRMLAATERLYQVVVGTARDT